MSLHQKNPLFLSTSCALTFAVSSHHTASFLARLGLSLDNHTLFRVLVSHFRSEESEMRWVSKSATERLSCVHDMELSGEARCGIRPQEASTIPVADFITLLAMTVGYPIGWSITFQSKGGETVTWTQEQLLQSDDRESLASFCRRFEKQGCVSILFSGAPTTTSLKPAAVETAAKWHPALLPWITDDRRGAAESKASAKRKGKGKGKRSRKSKTGRERDANSCVLSAFSERWRSARLVRRGISRRHYTWIFASLARAFKLEDGKIPEALMDLEEAVDGMVEKVTPNVLGSYECALNVLKHKTANNVLPLSPDLRKALNADELWLNPLSFTATWVVESKMPAPLFARDEMGPQDGFSKFGRQQRGAVPALFVASCRTLFVRYGSRRLNAGFVAQAGRVLRRRDVMTGPTCEGRKTVEEQRRDDIACFERWWLNQDEDEKREREWVLRLLRVARELLKDTFKDHLPGKQMSMVMQLVNAYLYGSLHSDPLTPGLFGACERAGESITKIDRTLRKVCEKMSLDRAQRTFNRLCLDYDHSAFLLAWPLLLSRESCE